MPSKNPVKLVPVLGLGVSPGDIVLRLCIEECVVDERP